MPSLPLTRALFLSRDAAGYGGAESPQALLSRIMAGQQGGAGPMDPAAQQQFMKAMENAFKNNQLLDALRNRMQQQQEGKGDSKQ